MVERQAENLTAVGSIPTRGICYPMLATPTRSLNLFLARRRRLAKKRVTPFNLKDVGKSFKRRLLAPLSLLPIGWVGPWVSINSYAGGSALGRLCLYAFNNTQLWVACPSKGGFNRAQSSWLCSALRGLSSLVTLKLRFKGKSFRWHRRRGALVLRFGHSHLVACRPPAGTRWRRMGKAKMVFFSSNVAVLREYLTSVVAWREPNRYHSRGLRLSKQRIVRKAGKVSAYR